MAETFLAKGKRGIVSLTKWHGKKAVVKRQNPSSTTLTLANEASYLKLLNKKGIGPKFYYSDKDSVVMEYIEGIRILEFFEQQTGKNILEVCKAVLEQCRTMDLMKVNKKELTNPYKHIIICRRNGKFVPVMIDFERCHATDKPKNVTQFLQFLGSGVVKHALGSSAAKIAFDPDKLRKLAKKYKEDFSEKNFEKIMEYVSAS